MQCMWSKVGMGGEHHRFYKYTKFRQNPRGEFLVDLTRNNPYAVVEKGLEYKEGQRLALIEP